MEVETLGVARSLGWKVHMRCANGYRQETRSMRRCVYHLLVWCREEPQSMVPEVYPDQYRGDRGMGIEPVVYGAPYSVYVRAVRLALEANRRLPPEARSTNDWSNARALARASIV